MKNLRAISKEALLARGLAEVADIHRKVSDKVVEIGVIAKDAKDQLSRVQNLPKGDKGEKGERGPQGIQGEPGIGKDGVDGKDGTSIDLIEVAELATYLITTPKDGKDGQSPQLDTIIGAVIDEIKSKDTLELDKKILGVRNEVASYRNQLAMKQSGQHGGGTTVSAGTNITLTPLPNGTTRIDASGGGGGTPGGLNTQIQYNNAGSFGGITGAVTDGTAVSLTAPHLLNPTINGAGVGLATLAYPNTASSATITLPTVTGTLATLAGTEALTNKSVNGVTLVSSGTSTLYLSQDGTYTTPAGTYVLPTASTSVLGGVKVDGTSITISAGVISATTGGTGTVTNVASADGSITVTNPTTTVDLAVVKSPKLTTARTIGTITGDGTSAGSTFDGTANNTNALVLATVNSNVGSFGSATAAGTFTVNGKGLITAAGSTTITPAVGSITGLGTGVATWLATPSSANLAAAVTDETGSGALVFANTPTLTTAVLGSSTATTQSPSDNSTKVATTAYVDAAVLGQNFKEAALVATTANLVGVYLSGVFTYTATGTNTIDGVTLALGNRVLVKNQTTTFQNGWYTVTTAGAIGIAGVLTRSTDANTSGEFKTGDSSFVTSGTTQSATTWAYTGVDSPTLGTDAITYVQTAGQGSFTAGNGIAITGNSIAIDTSVTVDKTTVQTLTNKMLTSPILTTPSLGVATATSINGNTITTGTGTLTLSTFTVTAAANATISGTNTGDQTITLTGDVTGSGTGSFATTIKTDVALAGNPTTTTQTAGNNTTRIATTAFVTAAVAAGGTVTSVSGTANRITSTGGATPVIDISASYVGQSSITTLGTVTTGTWNAGTVTATAAGLSLTASNTTDTASLNVIKLIGSRATPTANDEIYQAFYLNNNAPANAEFARITARATSVSSAAMAGQLRFGLTGTTAGTITDRMLLGNASLSPVTDDGLALGSTTTEWSDLFLASGGVINWANGNYTVTHSSGLLTTNGNLSLTTSGVLTTGTIELGAASDTTLSRVSAGVIAVEGVTVVDVSSAQTLTTKRITKRVTSSASGGATPTIATDTNDMVIFTAQAAAITNMSTNTTGTPTNGQTLWISITDNATPRAITWGGSYEASTVALPTTTVTSTRLDVGFVWNVATTKWRCVAVA